MRQFDARETELPWLFIVIWCALMFSSFGLAVAFQRESLVGLFVTGLMSLLGVYFIWRKVRKTLDVKKFGVVSFTQRWDTRACPGGQLAARLRIQNKVPAAREIEAEIRCQLVTWTKGARLPRVNEQVVWSSRKHFPLLPSGSGAGAEISFDIPSDAQPTDLPADRGDESALLRFRHEGGQRQHFHRWEVVVIAQVPGVDLERSFTVIIEPNQAADLSTTSVRHPAPVSARS